jgi:hypothetical protein
MSFFKVLKFMPSFRRQANDSTVSEAHFLIPCCHVAPNDAFSSRPELSADRSVSGVNDILNPLIWRFPWFLKSPYTAH